MDKQLKLFLESKMKQHDLEGMIGKIIAFIFSFTACAILSTNIADRFLK